LTIRWKYFSLEQINSKQGSDWKLWEQPDDYPSRGRNAFHAAEAARSQGEQAFDAFHYALLRARHVDKRNIADLEVLSEVAESVGVDVKQFREDIGDRRLLKRLSEDHTFAVDTLGVFGTPTLIFPKRKAVFLKMTPPPNPEESVAVFEDVRRLVEDRYQIKEIKRT
jgi:predicted DsbA family dithiol-disulfide isomerase